MMWLLFSIGAAFFAGIATIFGAIGVKNIDTSLATAIRTTIILLFSLIVVFIVGSLNEIGNINSKTLLFLIISGITTALLWLSYFKALQLGSVNKVTPIDKTSIILTLVLSVIFLKEKITIVKVISMTLILIGAIFMIVKKKDDINKSNRWFIYAALTSLFTSLTTIVGKIGIKDVESSLGMFLRTIIVFIIIWLVTFFKRKYKDIFLITKKGWLFLVLSGVSTGTSWLCYFKALQFGEASVVFSIEKLSIVVAVLCSTIFLKEKINRKSIIGLVIIVIGEVMLII